MSSKITVAVRARPLNERERRIGAKETIAVTPGEIKVTRSIDGYSKAFNFDFAYSPQPGANTYGSQEKIYKDIGVPILDEALKGINQCLFAYGQTGSGKSYTMTGYEDPGVIPRLTEDLFKRAESSNGEIQIWLTFMEIYNEKIRDLLRSSETSGEETLNIFEHDKLGVLVPDATMAPVGTLSEVTKLMAYGLSRRVSAATQMNDTSSRSHAICTFHIQTRTAMARINLIDLAGSERISKSEVTGDNQREASMINQSLTNLGIVIKALSERKDFVPFRNSKLTFLLKDSLSGNSRTYMVANISPSESEVEETISTLRFASNVKRVVTDPRVNYGSHEDMINSLRAEITTLKEQLAASSAQWSPKNDMGAQLKMRSAVLKMIDASLSKKVVEKRLSSATVSTDDPYLVNISNDPLRTGIFAIVLPTADTPFTIGSLEDQDKFVIRGPGVVPVMAQLVKEPTGSLTLKLTSAIGEVSVNGSMLAINQAKRLSRNDIIQFGSSCRFRVVVPLEEARAEESTDGEWSFVRNNFLTHFPGLSPQALTQLDLKLNEASRKLQTISDDDTYSVRVLLPSSVLNTQDSKPESMIVIERKGRSDGDHEFISLESFLSSQARPARHRNEGSNDLVGLLQTAKDRLDVLESRNKKLLEKFSRKINSN